MARRLLRLFSTTSTTGPTVRRRSVLVQQQQQHQQPQQLNGNHEGTRTSPPIRQRTDLKSLVACHIYVAAGGDVHYHKPILVRALERAQSMFRSELLNENSCNNTNNNHHVDGDNEVNDNVTHRQLQQIKPRNPWINNGPVGAVVDVHTDAVYNRSTFYLAGTAPLVATVASDLAVSLVRDLNDATSGVQSSPWNDPATVSYNAVAQHANIGLVDHVRVMPLYDVGQTLDVSDDYDDNEAWAPAGRAARQIAQALRRDCNMTVYLYGLAHPQGRALHEVCHKHRKNFKRLAGQLPPRYNKIVNVDQRHANSVTVGAPHDFIETHHVRLSRDCGKARAKFLSRLVRESTLDQRHVHEPGLKHVQAVTLPYSQGRFEIACNLLRPLEAGSRAIDISAAIRAYLKKCKTKEDIVEAFYRVGPTAKQCIQTLQHVSRSNPAARNRHDHQVAAATAQQFQREF